MYSLLLCRHEKPNLFKSKLQLLREQVLRLQSDTKLFNAKVETIHAEMVALKRPQDQSQCSEHGNQ